jgi:hypothetical protein
MRTDWMKRTGAFLLWTLVLLLLLAGLDQLLVRVPFSSPAPLAVATFYREVRSRLIELAGGTASAPAKPAKPNPSAPVKGAPPASPPPPTQPAPARLQRSPQVKEIVPRYIYADDRGELHFAATLAEIPEQFRERAKALGE